MYARFTNDSSDLPHYTGISRKNSRYGFNTGETDMSGLGYFGDVFRFWFGRGRQNWGSLYFDNLALSEKSASYEDTNGTTVVMGSSSGSGSGNNQSTESTVSFTTASSSGSGDSTIADLFYKNSG